MDARNNGGRRSGAALDEQIMSARIHLARDSGFADYTRQYKVVVDGEEKGQIKNGGTFECEIAPGRHTLELKVDWCGSNILKFEVADNEKAYFDCGSNLRGWKIFKASKIMREAPNEWIWLKSLSNKAMQATRRNARA